MIYDLASSSWGPEEIHAIQDVLETGRLTMGERVQEFEQAFAAKFGMRHAVMVNSGSSANLVGVAALSHTRERPLRRGDEVIVPAISWATTYHPLQQYGLKLRFVDVDLHTLNIDCSALEAALSPRTRMVVAVNILGNPAPLDILRAFCDRHDLYLFEDNCESMGASLDGRLCGTFGLVNTFSTFYSHHISTMEGGILLTDDEEIDHLARAIRNHGWARDVPPNTTLYTPKEDGFFEAYRFILPGYNVRPLELCGALGLQQLKKLDAMIEIRRKNASLFVSLFDGDSRFIIQRENGRSSWFSFTIILNPALGLDRARVMNAMRAAGIQFRMITGGCFLRHDAIRHFDYETVGDIVNANIAHDHGFFVGNHPRDLTAEITMLRSVLDEAVPIRSVAVRSKILVTGGAGYIGSVLCRSLLDAGHEVTVLDSFLYHQASLLDCCPSPAFSVARGDCRDERILTSLVREADAIIPLAAIVGAPICDADRTAAMSTNLEAIRLLCRLASPSQRILYPVTNSGYGIGAAGVECTEDSPLRPISLYGETKVAAEAVLARGNAITFRLATVFGVSPRMRLDLLVNDFVYRAVFDRALVLFEGHFKRNYIHVRDVAKAFLHGLGHFDEMKDRPYNVGLDDANLSKRELCEKIREHVPAFVFFEAAIGRDPDQRDYIVSNARIAAAGYRPDWTLDAGIVELMKAYQIVRRVVHANY